MSPPLSYRQHFAAVVALGLPLVGSHVAQFLLTLTDTILIGWYDVEALAAGNLAGGVFFVFLIFGAGFGWAVMPLVATAHAKGDATEVRRATRMGLWLSALFSVACLPVFLFARPIFLWLGQTEVVATLAQDYLRIAGFAIMPGLFVMVMKSYLAALGRANAVLWITLIAVPVNFAANWLLIFGNWGFPELGIRGAAIATVATSLLSAILTALYAVRTMPEHQLFVRLWRPDWEAFRTVFRLGLPIGLTALAEVGLFTASSVMMGWLGTLPLAAHGAALQISSMTFMVHLGLSNVATIRAGQALGHGNRTDLVRGSVTVLFCSGVAVAGTVALFLLAPEPLIGIFTDPDDPNRGAVIAIGAGLLAAAALFQLVDAAQVIGIGLLRGLQDTRVPMIVAAFSYWGVGLATAYVLGFVLGWGGVGIWLGLAAGLGVASVALMARFWTVGLARIQSPA
ncbi:MATE family efflux transporter [Anianabacter salinae]|uniref:MATE family efflux transporter n=1 Tax=Anianabacter salinae TaxID=2851023 RepID=UPI00225DE378|nr:MATE family efflux transporter [Anianabacter salinae]MBV0912549.1 MATE family efflux transporter [Anianabacter salinae]